MHARRGGWQCQWRVPDQCRKCWLRCSRDRGVYAGNCIQVFLLQNGNSAREQICETIPLPPNGLGPCGLRPHRNRQGNPSTPRDSGHAGSARRYGHTDAIKRLACSVGLVEGGWHYSCRMWISAVCNGVGETLINPENGWSIWIMRNMAPPIEAAQRMKVIMTSGLRGAL